LDKRENAISPREGAEQAYNGAPADADRSSRGQGGGRTGPDYMEKQEKQNQGKNQG
jgi:hypothetical protein